MAAAPFNSNKSDKSRMDLSEEEVVVNNDDCGESSVIVLSEGTIDVPVLDWDTALKMNCPLPSLSDQQLPADLPPLPPLPFLQIPADLPPLPPLPLSHIPADLPPSADLPPLPPLPFSHIPADLPPLPPLPFSQIPAVLPPLPPLPLPQRSPLPPLPLDNHHHKQKLTTPPAKSRVSLTLDEAIESELKNGRILDPNMDTKTLRRTVSNRLAAQRSRMRRSGYIHELEMKMLDLLEHVKNLKARVESHNENKILIQEENNLLRRALDIRANEAKIGKDYMEEMQREIIILKENLANYPLNNEVDEGQSFSNPIIPPAEEIELQESVTISPKPYSIEFYEQRLMQMEMNHHHHQHHHHLLIPADQTEPEPDDSLIGLINFDDDGEGEEGIDQYLNLDGMLNLDP